MSWFNKRKVTIDTKKESDNGYLWTFIDNGDCVVKRFYNTQNLVQYLYDNGFNAKSWIDDKVRHEVNKELSKKFNKHFTFYLNKDVAPFILNKMDAMECVRKWSVEDSTVFDGKVLVKYDASKQILFQSSNGAYLKED